MMENHSPRITSVSWGQVRVEGFSRPFRDVKLYPGGAREWDWTETGTHHSPGIQTADVQELLDRGATVVVLSTGMQQRLQICPETINLLQTLGITFFIRETKEAVRLYNSIQERKPVSALVHSTC